MNPIERLSSLVADGFQIVDVGSLPDDQLLEIGTRREKMIYIFRTKEQVDKTSLEDVRKDRLKRILVFEASQEGRQMAKELNPNGERIIDVDNSRPGAVYEADAYQDQEFIPGVTPSPSRSEGYYDPHGNFHSGGSSRGHGGIH